MTASTLSASQVKSPDQLDSPSDQQLITGVHAGEDLNHDGRVDILDAFQLARQLQTGQKPAAGLDLNGDGVVDWRDVEVLATRAVHLEKGGQS
jgi:hypothetical protein